MLSIKDTGPRTPEMPEGRLTGAARLAASSAVHALAASTLLLVLRPAVVPEAQTSPPSPLLSPPADVRNIVFIAREPQAGRGRGGGGGGDHQTHPIRRAHGIGPDAITLRVTTPVRPAAAEAVPDVALPQPLILDAKPLLSGVFDQIGLPNSLVEERISAGPGSDNGVGTGTGPGIGPGQGPGVGPGSLGGIGGEPYRPGGAVSAPRALVEVKPTYTSNAMRSRIQGTVVLEFVVTREGRPSQIRVIRSLDPELDQQAIDAAGRWRFEPGRLAGDAVNVLVTLMLDFRIR